MVIGIAATAICDRMLLRNGMADIGNDQEAYQAFMDVNGTLFTADFILQMIGSLAFPLFCFLLVEGFMHSSSLKKYAASLGILAVVSEIPLTWSIAARYSIPAGRTQSLHCCWDLAH